MLLTLATLAFAAAPGGFRFDAGLPVRSIGVRQVVAPGEVWTIQTVPRVHWTWRRFGVDAQLPALATFGSGWSDAGLGDLRLGLYHHFGRNAWRQQQAGVELAAPVVPRSLWVAAWGSHPSETLPAFELTASWTWTSQPEAPLSLRAAIGWSSGPYRLWYTTWSHKPDLVAELALAKVYPLGRAFAAVGEIEVTADRRAPVTGRALGRVHADRAAFDLGLELAAPPRLERYGVAASASFALRAVGAARWFF